VCDCDTAGAKKSQGLSERGRGWKSVEPKTMDEQEDNDGMERGREGREERKEQCSENDIYTTSKGWGEREGSGCARVVCEGDSNR
jgi:hypothetical protein